MKKFTREDIMALKRGVYDGMSYDECKQTYYLITGVRGEFKYEVEPGLQKIIDEMASRNSYVEDKGRWKSLEDAKKAHAWHAYCSNL